MRCGRKEEGYGIVSHEGTYGFVEGRSKFKRILTKNELASLNKCCQKRGIGSVTSQGSTVVGGVRFT